MGRRGPIVNDVLSQLKNISQAVSYAASASSLERVLENIAQVCLDLVQAKYAALGVPDSKGGLKYFKVAGLSTEEARQIGHLPTGKGLLGVIMKERKTLRLENMRDDPRAAGFCANHPFMTSLLGVPILVADRLYGSLYLCDRTTGQPFTEQDQWIIETMAGYAALAIAGAELAEHSNRVTLLEERERFGMEMHDGVIQSLYAIGMHLDLTRSSGNLKPGDLTQPIEDLNTVIEDIRRYILNLKARDQGQKTVLVIFTELLERLHIPKSITTELSATDDFPPFTPGVFEGICQITYEAISNTIRHSGATRLEVTARERENAFEIIIADNGKGFEYEKVRRGEGLGLGNIRQRALLFGGTLTVDSAANKGATITIHIPI